MHDNNDIAGSKLQPLDSYDAESRLLHMLDMVHTGDARVLVIVTDAQPPLVLTLPDVQPHELLRAISQMTAVGQALLVEAHLGLPAKGDA